MNIYLNCQSKNVRDQNGKISEKMKISANLGISKNGNRGQKIFAAHDIFLIDANMHQRL